MLDDRSPDPPPAVVSKIADYRSSYWQSKPTRLSSGSHERANSHHRRVQLGFDMLFHSLPTRKQCQPIEYFSQPIPLSSFKWARNAKFKGLSNNLQFLTIWSVALDDRADFVTRPLSRLDDLCIANKQLKEIFKGLIDVYDIFAASGVFSTSPLAVKSEHFSHSAKLACMTSFVMPFLRAFKVRWFLLKIQFTMIGNRNVSAAD